MRGKVRITVLAVLSTLMLGPMGQSVAMGEVAKVATWYGNYDAAVSLRFDDNRDSHIDVVVPTLDRYGFKATFMVNPGKRNYIQNRDFWEREVVAKGHRLGNHTMHHRGAKTLEEAEYEIGEAAKILRSVQRDASDLMVFAAGGRTKWGGEEWEKSSESYKHLPKIFYLIDLYDGFHKAKNFHSTHTPEDLCAFVQKAIEKRSHQGFVFHDIGRPGVKALVKRVVYGYHLTMGKENFTEYLDCLADGKEHLWIAPLIQIYKYETERNNASLRIVENRNNLVRLKLIVDTDPTLYDQKLTLVMPASGRKVLRILQEGDPIQIFESDNNMVLMHVEPKTSEIAIYRE